MLVLIILIFVAQLATLIYMYIGDRQLKWLSENGGEKAKLLALVKYKYCYVYYKRKHGIITKYVYLCMITYYIINFVGVIAIIIQLCLFGNNILAITCVILVFNAGLLTVAAAPSANAFEQQLKVKNINFRSPPKQ